MSWIVLIIAGGIIGWLASLIMRDEAEHSLLINIIIGIVGSLLGKWFFVDVLSIGGAAAAGTLSLAGFFWGVLGAIILIIILRALKIMR